MAEYRSISAGFEIAEFISAKQADATAWSKFHLSKETWIGRGHGSTNDANSLALRACMEGMFIDPRYEWSILSGPRIQTPPS